MNHSAETTLSAAFIAEVERVRAGAALGRGTQLSRLFEFLVGCQASGRVPKELEVAMDCFERGAGVDVAQDATVRVTAHKLRKRLEEFYRDAEGGTRLTIPRGEYRLALESPAVTPARPGSWRRLLPATPRERIAALVAVVALAAAAAAGSWALRMPSPPAEVARLRASPLWAPLFADVLPVQLVLGDYYIFGERDAHGDIQRLVRDFSINSREDLERGFIGDPQRVARFADLNLGYLPTSSAQALRELLPVLMSSGKQVTLTLASELDPATIKTTHIVYVGYLSALGMLQDMVLGTSRYSIGGSYDELIDSVSGEAWVSEAGEAHAATERYRDYAYLARIAGPGGQAHLIVAGTRDTGLMQAAEAVADPARVRELTGRVPADAPFEALYEVQSVNGVNVESRLVGANRIEP
ncbi:MAG: hypothetical protein ABW278_06090 [Steroidobacteraceae bacterium]